MVKDVITEDFDWQFDVGKGIVTCTQKNERVTAKAEQKMVLTKSAKFSVSGYTGGEINIQESGASGEDFTFAPQAQYTKALGEEVLLDGDQVTLILYGQKVNPLPPPSQIAAQQTVTITLKAKQHTVKGS